jgi:3-oxosteroid 1-dehydrogenase
MSWDISVDFLVVGSGAAGMTAALRARELGAEVLIVEKASLYGGSSALSGGVVWVPNNPLMRRLGMNDSIEEALTYLEAVTRGSSRRDKMRAYLQAAPRMMSALMESSHVRFECLTDYPDYYPEAPGGRPGGRSCEPVTFDALQLGTEFARMRCFAPERMIMNGRMMVNVKDGMRMLKGGLPAAWLMVRRLWQYYSNRRARRQGPRLTDVNLGAALIGRLRLSLMQRNVPLWLETPIRELVCESGRVVGAVVEHQRRTLCVQSRGGVLLAAGGFEHNAKLRRRYQPEPTGDQWTSGCDSNTGDALELGRAIGGAIDLMDECWWCPAMLAPFPSGKLVWIVIFEKNLPGGIIVNRAGRRFTNEAAPYNDVVKEMYSADASGTPSIPAFLVFDARYRRKYPCGPLMPAYAVPDRFVPARFKDDLLKKDRSLEGLARQIGVAPDGLRETVQRFNEGAARGEDPEFHRGESLQDRYYAPGGEGPNPTLGALDRPPFYAVEIYPGDLGTKGGLRTDTRACVLDQDGDPIPGLYAAGNCSAAVMGRSYPGAGATIGPAMTFGFLAAEDAFTGSERR